MYDYFQSRIERFCKVKTTMRKLKNSFDSKNSIILV